MLIWIMSDYHAAIPHYGTGSPHYPGNCGQSLFYSTAYALLPLSCCLLTFIGKLRAKPFILWLAILALHLFYFPFAALGAMHNNSTAFFYFLQAILFGAAGHLLAVPFVHSFLSVIFEQKHS